MRVRIETGPAPIPGEEILRARIPASQAAKTDLVERAMAAVEARIALDEMDRFRVRLSLDEALQNALTHGCGEDPRKSITLVLFDARDRWGAAVSDEGEGFSRRAIPDPTDPEGVLKESGRGILIMSQYMDEVSYYDGGRTVVLARSKSRGANAGSAGARGSARSE